MVLNALARLSQKVTAGSLFTADNAFSLSLSSSGRWNQPILGDMNSIKSLQSTKSRGGGLVAIVLATLLCWGGASSDLIAQEPAGRIEPAFVPLVPPQIPPAEVPAAPDAALLDELNRLRARLDSLEADQNKRASLEKAKKATEAVKPTMKWSAQLQTDFYTFDQNPESQAAYGDIENGVDFRRARTALFGDYKLSEYRIEFDFAQSGRPTFLDVYGGLHDVPYLGRVRFGHFFEPFSMERMTSNRYTTFMERAITDIFAPARNTGVASNNTWDDEQGTWSFGAFRSDSDHYGDEIGDNFETALTARVTRLLYYDDACDGRDLWHVGASYSFRGANNEVVRFRAQPEAREGAASPNVPFFVDTGNIPADTFQIVDLETALIRGPFSILAEYVYVPVNSQSQGTLAFDGWFAQASYFLTGEHRPYNKKLATFDRLIPKTEFIRSGSDSSLNSGPGAWEIATRVSHLNLNDGPVHGGRITDWTIGLNWYLNPYLRVTTNYIYSMANSPTVDGTATNIFGMRAGFEF